MTSAPVETWSGVLAPDLDPAAAVARFFDFQDEIGRLIAASNDLDLGRNPPSRRG